MYEYYLEKDGLRARILWQDASETLDTIRHNYALLSASCARRGGRLVLLLDGREVACP